MHSNFSRPTTTLALIAALGGNLLLAGCGPSGQSPEPAAAEGDFCADGKITLGSAKALSGSFSYYDTAASHAEELAVELVNEQGGINGCEVELVTQDMKSDPAVARQVASELIADGADVFLPPNTDGLGTPAAQEAQREGVFSMAGASGDDYAPAVGALFATGGSMASLNGATAAAFAADQGYDSVYYVTNDTFAYFGTVEEYFRENIGDELTDLGSSAIEFGQTDFAAVISDIKRTVDGGENPMILLATNYPDAPTMVNQLRKAGLDTPVVGNATWATKNIVDALGGETENVYYTAGAYTEGDDAPEATVEYVNRYKEKYGTFPENHQAVESYWTMWALFDAIGTAESTDGAAIEEALFAQTDLELPMRTVYQWKDGHILGSNVVVGFDADGAFELVETYNLSGGE